jgi:hypothetical protein
MKKGEARIKCFGNHVPVENIEVVDIKQMIWKGERIIEPGTPQDTMKIVYFSRRYEDNDIDKLFREYTLTNETIMGRKFSLIPKEKLLFGYDPPSDTIIKPPIKLTKPRIFN